MLVQNINCFSILRIKARVVLPVERANNSPRCNKFRFLAKESAFSYNPNRLIHSLSFLDGCMTSFWGLLLAHSTGRVCVHRTYIETARKEEGKGEKENVNERAGKRRERICGGILRQKHILNDTFGHMRKNERQSASDQ